MQKHNKETPLSEQLLHTFEPSRQAPGAPGTRPQSGQVRGRVPNQPSAREPESQPSARDAWDREPRRTRNRSPDESSRQHSQKGEQACPASSSGGKARQLGKKPVEQPEETRGASTGATTAKEPAHFPGAPLPNRTCIHPPEDRRGDVRHRHLNTVGKPENVIPRREFLCREAAAGAWPPQT